MCIKVSETGNNNCNILHWNICCAHDDILFMVEGKREGSFQISPSAPTIWHRIWEVEENGGSFASVETAGKQMEAHVRFAKSFLQRFHPFSTLEKLVGR